MPDAAQEIEQVPWAIGDRRAGEEINLWRTDQGCPRIVRYAQQFEAVRGSLAVILDEVRLIEDDPGPWDTMKTLGIPRDDVVIYDHPTRIMLLVIRNTQHLDLAVGIYHLDLAPPVELERGGADHEDYPGWGSDLHSDDRLAGLTQAHVVAKDRSPLGD